MYAPAFFLASRERDEYPSVGLDLTLGPTADVARLLQSLTISTRLLAGVVNDTPADVRAVIFLRPEVLIAPPKDFAPRGALELILHAHDVCSGLGVRFEPPTDLCHRLREHTRPWRLWTFGWDGLGQSEDPWADMLEGSGRHRLNSPE